MIYNMVGCIPEPHERNGHRVNKLRFFFSRPVSGGDISKELLQLSSVVKCLRKKKVLLLPPYVQHRPSHKNPETRC